jgi:drug/metabolite transporter (DMT)-like permease
MNATLKGSLSATAALAAVGSLVAAADVIADYPVAAGQAARYALAGVLLTAVGRGRLARPSARELASLTALAATGLVLFNLCVVGAVQEGDPGTVGVVVGCVPVVLAIAAPLLEGRRPSPRLVAAGIVVAVGAAGVEQAGAGLSSLGVVLAIGALVCEACFSLIAVPLLRRLSPVTVSAYSCLLAVPLAAACSLIADGAALPAPTLAELAALAYLGSVVTVGGFVLWYVAIGLLGVERAGLFSGVLPISALACAAAIGAGDITAAKLAAMLMVLLGITLGMRAAPSDSGPRGERGQSYRRTSVAPAQYRRSPSSVSAGSLRTSDGVTLRARAAEPGSHQFQRPRMEIVAGARTPRTTVASSRTPAASAVADILTSVPGLALRATKARPRMSAALVTRRPVRPMPSTTADWVDPVRSYVSRIRQMMKTW